MKTVYFETSDRYNCIQVNQTRTTYSYNSPGRDSPPPSCSNFRWKQRMEQKWLAADGEVGAAPEIASFTPSSRRRELESVKLLSYNATVPVNKLRRKRDRMFHNRWSARLAGKHRTLFAEQLQRSHVWNYNCQVVNLMQWNYRQRWVRGRDTYF